MLTDIKDQRELAVSTANLSTERNQERETADICSRRLLAVGRDSPSEKSHRWIFHTECFFLKEIGFSLCGFVLSMYDQDGNGWIDLVEMTRIVKSIYSMMGPEQVELQLLWKNMSITQVKASVEEQQSPEERAQGIFTRMDINSDGKVTRSKLDILK